MASSSDLVLVALLVFFICWTRLGLCEDDATDLDRPYPDYHEEKPSTRIPQFISHGGFIAVKPGDTIRLKCEVDQLGDLTMMWRKGSSILAMNQMRLSKDHRITLNKEDYSLQIQDASISDEGLYTCTISASVPLVQSYVIKLLQATGHHRHHHHHHKQMENISWNVGNDIKMQCLVGDPATVSWTHEDEPVTNTHVLRIISDVKGNRGILIKNLQPKFFGSYKCLVNLEQQQSLEAEFEINVVPKIEVVKERINVDEGITLDIICRFSGYPIPKIRWMHGSRSILGRDRILISNSEKQSKLTIRFMQQVDFGNYTCIAENKVGSGNQTVELTAETEQLGNAGIVNVRSSPYGEYSNHYELMFEVESFNPIIEYLLRIKERDEESSITDEEGWKEVIIPANSSGTTLYSQVYDITGLRPNSEYYIYMQARNLYGWNNRSGIFTFYTKREGKPISPRNDTVIEKTMATTNAPYVSEVYSSYSTTNSPEVLDSSDSAGFHHSPTKGMVIVLITMLLVYFT